MRDPQKEAQRVLRHVKVATRPVNVESIAERLGAKVVKVDLDDKLCGMLHKEAGQHIIGVNSSHSVSRQRFTIAHEIGHLVMHDHLISDLHVDKSFSERLYRDGRSKTGEDKIEREANRFAAELLMPTELLHEDVSEVLIDLVEGPKELAELYEVSEQAMSIKLMQILGKKYYS